MLKLLTLLSAFLFFTACGARPVSVQGESQSKVQLSFPSAKLIGMLKGKYHSDCSEWSNGFYHAYAISDYRFDVEDQYEQNTTYYLDSECKVLLSQYASSGIYAFEQANPVFYFRPNGAELRVFNPGMATYYDSENFCGGVRWRGQEWRNVMNRCLFGLTQPHALSVKNNREMNLYPCEDPNRDPAQCRVIQLKKVD